jgi:hypothetical protein
MNENSMKQKVVNFYQRNKTKIWVGAGALVALTVGVVLSSKSKQEEEIVELPTKSDDVGYSLHWFQSKDPDHSWTLDLPVMNDKTVEETLQTAMDDLNNENYEEVEL